MVPTTSRAVQWPETTQVYYPDSSAFVEATARWNAFKAPGYDAAISPSTEEEVVAINSIPFLATGGRHGYGTTLATLQNGLAVDLSRINEVSIKTAGSTLTVGGGAKHSDVLASVYEAGFQLPSGSCSAVGFVGATLGAGVGVFSGIYGLLIDSLLSVRMVTASGDLIEISESSNSDLFWALRGAGANFGIMTSATYRLRQQTNKGEVFVADLIYPAAFKESYFNVLQALEDNWPPEQGINSAIFWDPSSNATCIMGTFVYTGPETDARRVLAPFFNLNPSVSRVVVVPFYKVPSVLLMGMIEGFCDTKEGIHSIHSLNVRKFSAETYVAAVGKFEAFFETYPAARSSAAVLETFSNAQTSKVSDDATAYPWRDAKRNFMFQMGWEGLDNPIGSVADDFARQLRADFVATSGYPELSVYVCYAWGDETLEQIYGRDKLPRLLALKKTWDPDNVFEYSNALPTKYPVPYRSHSPGRGKLSASKGNGQISSMSPLRRANKYFDIVEQASYLFV
ncbi:Uu.00g083390.m01.CDS01 [Anthostomella pinea]|uniref:Uu.00g083390.m01.CDS01 n=1 Tax=Anthostomella pinea TaxID=933095 RepID=A0AAI8VLM4_9PEZI|nr:Uu.00g083390.m01.CDS01 [Anthostomella pinea]